MKEGDLDEHILSGAGKLGGNQIEKAVIFGVAVCVSLTPSAYLSVPSSLCVCSVVLVSKRVCVRLCILCSPMSLPTCRDVIPRGAVTASTY